MTWLNIVGRTLSISFILCLTLAGCASSGSSNRSGDEKEELTLRQHLQRINGVNIRGSQENTRITIRASGSLQQNRGKQPLFVVDGNIRGRSFYDVASDLKPEEIVSVRVLRGSGANMYGSRGGQGVIVIKTTREK